jgi:hypothetical protein
MKTLQYFSPLTVGGAWRSLACALLATGVAVGCGGGGVDTGGTGTTVGFSAGRISGFGSIIVNGVRFDDSTASVVDDDGAAHQRGELKLGMVTEVNSGPVSVDQASGVASSTATSIKFGSAIKGPVESIDVAAGTLVVLGQSVKVDASTVLEDLANGLSSITVGGQVEIHAFFDNATTSYSATRIEPKTGLVDYKLVGPIAGLNPSAKTFAIGGATISFASVLGAVPTLSNGLVVRAHLQTAQQGGTWIATSLGSGVPTVVDGAETEVEGFITDFTSSASFKVNGVAVDASGSGVEFKHGSAAQLANGVRIEVEGVTRSSVLVAKKIDVKTRGGGDQEFELHGAVESVNAQAQSFVLRGVTVTYDNNTRFDDGSAANLVVGASVEVKGLLSNGNRLAAARIKFKN